jgi:tetratricopeptide (TPR) repeat protein
MSQLQERIAQFQKMANDDPTNELGHFRLGSLYLEAGQYEDAVRSFQRTLELEPQFAKVYQLLGTALVQLGKTDDAVKVLQDGFQIADEHGHNIPRDEMSKLLVQLGHPAPTARPAQPAQTGGASDTGFHCDRPGCPAGRYARQLAKPPMNDELGQQVYERVCADCWNYWLRDLSIKVINEMRLDLSSEQAQRVYDQIMKESLGLV